MLKQMTIEEVSEGLEVPAKGSFSDGPSVIYEETEDEGQRKDFSGFSTIRSSGFGQIQTRSGCVAYDRVGLDVEQNDGNETNNG
jgi:hypothetical protein